MDTHKKKCYIVTGHNPKFLYKIGLALLEKDFKTTFDFKVSWDKDSSTLDFLNGLAEDTNSSEQNSNFYLVGTSYSNHLDYLDQKLDCELKKIFIHSDFSSFCEDVLADFEYDDNPFLSESIFNNYPTYGFNYNYSFKDYFKKYYLDVQENLDDEGTHFLVEDFLSKKKVNIDVTNSLGLDRNFYFILEKFLDFDFNLKTFVEKNRDNFVGVDSSEKLHDALMVTFVRPSEFHFFQRQVYEVLNALRYYESKEGRDVNFEWRVHLDLSDFYVDWESSELTKSYLYSAFYELKGELNEYINTEFSCFDETIHGCNDLRRNSIEKYSHSFESFVWLDPDVLFPKTVFYQISKFLPDISKNNALYGLIPEFLYSESKYLEPLVADHSFDVDRASFQDLDRVNQNNVSIERINNLPVCGSFSIISTQFLELTGIPEELGYYGNDDRYVNECFRIFNNCSNDKEHVLLYKLKNLIVTQIKEKVKKDNPFSSYLSFVDRESKHEMHNLTQGYLDKLFQEFKSKMKDKFHE